MHDVSRRRRKPVWRWGKRIIRVGVLAGAVYALWRVLDERSKSSELTWTAQPFPSPPRPEVRPEVRAEVPLEIGAEADYPPAEPDAPWVQPDDRGVCPVTHPLKAKLQSGIFHEPGGQMYDRTVPDRCYRDADAATADGLRVSKR
jgi:hypothetical protein